MSCPLEPLHVTITDQRVIIQVDPGLVLIMLDVQSQSIPVEPLEAVPGQVDQCQVVHVAKGIRGQLHYLILVQVNLKMINIYVKNVLQAITYLPSNPMHT